MSMFGANTTQRIQVPNLQKKICYFNMQHDRDTLRARFKCGVCGYEAHDGWSSIARCPSCGCLGCCKYVQYYNKDEIYYILTKAVNQR